MLLATQTSLAFADKGKPPPPTLPSVPPHIKLEVADKGSNEDLNWPIIREERSVKTDKATNEVVVETLVVRMSPPGAKGPLCDEPLPESIMAAASSCVKTGVASFYRTMTVGKITIRVKHFTDAVCNGANCIWNRPTRMEVSWTRTDNRWFTTNAYVGWGCYACSVCTGGSWSSVWTSSTWTPAWNGNNSSIYIFTSSSYPAMYPFDGTGDRASGDSDAYENWSYRGHLQADPGF